MMFTLICPIFPFFLQIVVIGFWLTVAVFLASTGRNQSFEFNNSSNYKYPNGTYDYDKIKGATSQFLDKLVTILHYRPPSFVPF